MRLKAGGMGQGLIRARRIRGSCLAVGLLLLGAGAAWAEPPSLPGITSREGRDVVDASRPPWNAIAKLQTSTGAKCSATLIAPRKVLTAAHCLYNPRTQRLLPASSLHLLFGYDRGEMQAHILVASYEVGLLQGEAPSSNTLARDWALLTTATDVRATPIPLLMGSIETGATLVAAGFNQDRAHVLMADLSCHATGPRQIPGGEVMAHDCEATRGTSGGPLLQQTPAGWRVAGVLIGAGPSGNIAFQVHSLPLAVTKSAP